MSFEANTAEHHYRSARVRSLSETAEIAGISLATLRRAIDEGSGPILTRVSARCVGVRDDHREAWLDRCAQPETV
jgi:hypothetical protein